MFNYTYNFILPLYKAVSQAAASLAKRNSWW